MFGGGAGASSSGTPGFDANGWTVISPTDPFGQGSGFSGTGSRRIYVSSSGSDSNTGTQASPVLTIAHGITLLRNNKPDQLLMKCGDTFTNDPISSVAGISGLSPASPILYSSYGIGARPIIRTNGATNGNNGAFFIDGSAASNVAVIGLDFYAHTRDPANGAFTTGEAGTDQTGVQVLGASSNILIEDCLIRFFTVNVVAQTNTASRLTNVTLRRSIIVDAYATSAAHAQGAFINNVDTLLLEDNLFDFNGWNTTVAGANPDDRQHDCYINFDCTKITVRNNIFANASSQGCQVRPGGTVDNNLFVHNPIAMNCIRAGGSVTNNVVTEACDITQGPNAAIVRWGYEIGPSGVACLVKNNLAINEVGGAGGNGNGISINTQTDTGNFTLGSATITNVTDARADGIQGRALGCALSGPSIQAGAVIVSVSGFDGNGGPGTVVMDKTATGPATGQSYTFASKNVTVSNNIVFNQEVPFSDGGVGTVSTGNVFDATGANNLGAPEPFSAPSRSVGSYAGSLGLTATLTAFLAQARLQSKSNWNANYTAPAANNYLRAGYGR